MGVRFKEVDNSLLNRAEDLVDSGITESFSGRGLWGCFVYTGSVKV